MIAGRLIGRLLWGLAFLAAGAEAVRSLEAAAWRPLALGEIWFAIDVGSLNLLQAVIQRYIWPPLWDPALVTALLWPAWAYAAVLGTLMLWLCRRRPARPAAA